MGAFVALAGIVLLFASSVGSGLGALSLGCICMLVAVVIGINSPDVAGSRAVEATAGRSGVTIRRTDVVYAVGEAIKETVGKETLTSTHALITTDSNTQTMDPFRKQVLSRGITVRYADINGDGEDELLVQHGTGAHSWEFKVFGWSDEPFTDFGQIAELFTSHGGFSISDVDNDGRLEVAMVDHDYDEPGGSMANGPFIEKLFRWQSSGFQEVDSHKIASPKYGEGATFNIWEHTKWHKPDRV
jgi:hypothetical protein